MKPQYLPAVLAPIANSLISIGSAGDYRCVYFLCDRGQVVYVGRTKNPWARIRRHSHSMTFDSTFLLPFLDASLRELEDLESVFICIFKPQLNKSGLDKRICREQEIILKRFGIEILESTMTHKFGHNSTASGEKQHELFQAFYGCP